MGRATRANTSHIELWGYPGAGKTTTARAAKRAGLSRVHEMRADTAKLSFDCKLARARAAFAQIKAEQAAAIESADADGSVLFDEGLLNEIWRQLYRNPEFIGQDWWHEYLADAQSRIIVLDVAPDCARERIRSKPDMGPINLELRDAPLDGEQWERARMAYDAILRELTARRPDFRFVRYADGAFQEPHEAIAAHLA